MQMFNNNANNNFSDNNFNSYSGRRIQDIRSKANSYNNDYAFGPNSAALPFEIIDINQLLMQNNSSEMYYITRVYKTLVDMEFNLRDYANISKQNLTVRQLKKIIPEMENICDCVVDFVNKFPEYSSSIVVKQSFYLIGIIIDRVEENIRKYQVKNSRQFNRKILILCLTVIAITLVIIFIILKETGTIF